jgi:predicted O-methyltransferase YrrM
MAIHAREDEPQRTPLELLQSPTVQDESLKERVKREALERFGIHTHDLRPGNLMFAAAKTIAGRRGFELTRDLPEYPLSPAIDADGIEVLADPDFRAAVEAIKGRTILDVGRLANIWQLVRETPPGPMLEIGSPRGGGALLMALACSNREVLACDPWSRTESFESLDPDLDRRFVRDQFADSSVLDVRRFYIQNGNKVEAVQGFFPDSVRDRNLQGISFVHLDVDVYQGTRNSLDYLANRMAPGGIIVLDDFRREAMGVDQAVREFETEHPGLKALPIFPGQGMIRFS